MAGSNSTVDVLETIRSALVNTAMPATPPWLGEKLADAGLLGGRLYIIRPPEDAVYPYAVMRLNLATSGTYNGERATGVLEVVLYDRPVTEVNLKRLEQMADVAQGALFAYSDASGGGLIFSRQSARQTLPPFIDPADANLAAVRVTFDITVWPRVLTRYVHP